MNFLLRIVRRYTDWRRECRIRHYARCALLAAEHGHYRAMLLHYRNLREEQAARSPDQVARLAKKAARSVARRVEHV